MSSLSYFVWLAEMVLDCLSGLWFVALPLVVVGAVGWKIAGPRSPAVRRLEWMTWGAMAAAAQGMLVVGTIFARGNGLAAPGSAWPDFLTGVLMLGSFIGGVVLVARSPGSRTFSAGTSLLGLWVLLLAQFVAGMSVSGSWL